MSWFQALTDEFTLRPFEIQQTHSSCISMASGHLERITNQVSAEVIKQCSGEKKTKLQMLRKFFSRKKKKEPSAAETNLGLKASRLSECISKAPETTTLSLTERHKGSRSQISLGSKALSHDSVFVSDSSEANEPLETSQESIHGKVKSLQLQLKQTVKKRDDTGMVSEDDGLPYSPPEYMTLHTAMVESHSLLSLEVTDSDDDQLSSAASRGAVSLLVIPGDFSQPASSIGCLDNCAAKHKLGLRQKACNKRKPLVRVDVKAYLESVVIEVTNTVMTKDLGKQEHEKTPEVMKAPDNQPPPSSKLILTTSSQDSPRAMPPSFVGEYFLDHLDNSCTAEGFKSNVPLTVEEVTVKKEKDLFFNGVPDSSKTTPLSCPLHNGPEETDMEINEE